MSKKRARKTPPAPKTPKAEKQPYEPPKVKSLKLTPEAAEALT